jgi:hypothetical protein
MDAAHEREIEALEPAYPPEKAKECEPHNGCRRLNAGDTDFLPDLSFSSINLGQWEDVDEQVAEGYKGTCREEWANSRRKPVSQ